MWLRGGWRRDRMRIEGDRREQKVIERGMEWFRGGQKEIKVNFGWIERNRILTDGIKGARGGEVEG